MRSATAWISVLIVVFYIDLLSVVEVGDGHGSVSFIDNHFGQHSQCPAGQQIYTNLKHGNVGVNQRLIVKCNFTGKHPSGNLMIGRASEIGCCAIVGCAILSADNIYCIIG